MIYFAYRGDQCDIKIANRIFLWYLFCARKRRYLNANWTISTENEKSFITYKSTRDRIARSIAEEGVNPAQFSGDPRLPGD